MSPSRISSLARIALNRRPGNQPAEFLPYQLLQPSDPSASASDARNLRCQLSPAPDCQIVARKGVVGKSANRSITVTRIVPDPPLPSRYPASPQTFADAATIHPCADFRTGRVASNTPRLPGRPMNWNLAGSSLACAPQTAEELLKQLGSLRFPNARINLWHKMALWMRENHCTVINAS